MAARYVLEVFQPGSADDPLHTIESDSPFMGMSAGDLIHPLEAPGATTASALVITRMEHIVWSGLEGSGLRHKISVFTARVDNLREARRGGAPQAF